MVADTDVRVVPLWVARAFVAVAVVLVPWIVWLVVRLPDPAVANHWRLAWGGFDLGLALAIGTTGILLARRSLLSQSAATVTATLLVCDAWFDVLTSRGTADVAFSIALALVAELPLAVLCIWIARTIERSLHERLVPPS